MNSWPADLTSAFWSKTERSANGCLTWTGHLDKYGYGRFRSRRHHIDIKSHRASFWLTHGWLPGLVRHSCDNPPCLDPRHLLGGDHASNARDAIERGQYVARKRKLSDELEQEIRGRYSAGGVTYRSLAAEYGLSYGLMQHVMKRGE